MRIYSVIIWLSLIQGLQSARKTWEAVFNFGFKLYTSISTRFPVLAPKGRVRNFQLTDVKTEKEKSSCMKLTFEAPAFLHTDSESDISYMVFMAANY